MLLTTTLCFAWASFLVQAGIDMPHRHNNNKRSVATGFRIENPKKIHTAFLFSFCTTTAAAHIIQHHTEEYIKKMIVPLTDWPIGWVAGWLTDWLVICGDRDLPLLLFLYKFLLLIPCSSSKLSRKSGKYNCKAFGHRNHRTTHYIIIIMCERHYR